MSKAAHLSREQAMAARPICGNIVAREPLDAGGERITIAVPPSRMQRLVLRLRDQVKLRFELDAFGVEVLALCDGKTPVRKIAAHFARTHKLDAHEAEQAVVTFLRMLLRKGVVQMVVAKGD